jgi:hypothetical protein
VGRNHPKEGEGKGMGKTQNFRKVEELIELRKQLRSITGVVESIAETIRLWQKSDKLDEYWEYAWCSKSKEINICVATLQADIGLVLLIGDLLRNYYWFNYKICRNQVPAKKERLKWKSLASSRPVIHKMIALRRTAEKTTSMVQINFEQRWERWIRKEFRAEASLVHDMVLTLVSLEIEIEEHWAFIAGLPNRMETRPLEAAAN